MLIERDAEDRIVNLINALASSFSVYAIGRDLGQSHFKAFTSSIGLTTAQKLTFLEQSYVAGKLASQVGVSALKAMTEDDLVRWMQTNNVHLLDKDNAILESMRRDTERWIQGRSDAWNLRIKREISFADAQWRGQIASTLFNDAAERSTVRNAALQELISNVTGQMGTFKGEVDRLVQSEMNQYFQMGQMSDVPGDEIVYKIPRVNACKYCLDIYLNADGSPKKFKLKDVLNNSNMNAPPGAWRFKIGPTHPYCYCVLYRETDQKAPGPNDDLKNARIEALKKSHSHDHKSLCEECGISDDPNKVIEEILAKNIKNPKAIPPHVELLTNVVKKVYSS